MKDDKQSEITNETNKLFEFIYTFQKSQFFDKKLTSKHFIEESDVNQDKVRNIQVYHNNSIIFKASSMSSRTLNGVYLNSQKSLIYNVKTEKLEENEIRF